jgi:hypothetical protein
MPCCLPRTFSTPSLNNPLLFRSFLSSFWNLAAVSCCASPCAPLQYCVVATWFTLPPPLLYVVIFDALLCRWKLLLLLLLLHRVSCCHLTPGLLLLGAGAMLAFILFMTSAQAL